ncbi:MAG: TRAP transporter substrate-binding protein [Acidimicrobiia bacterium]
MPALWIGGYGPEHSAHGKGLATFRDRIQADTNGEITVLVTWNIMEGGRPNTDLLDLVEKGEMFMCYFSSSYLGHRVPALNVLETPFVFDDLDHAHRALDGALGRRLADEVLAFTAFELLGFWDNGFRHFTNRLRPVFAPADCRGMKVRMQPNAVHEELVRAWGAEPVAVDLSEAIRLIVDGQVDAQENPLANMVAYGVDQFHSHVTMTGHLYGARGLWAHRATLESMPNDLRRIVDRAAQEAVAAQRLEAEAAEKRLRGEMESRGIAFVDLDSDGRAIFQRASAPAIALARGTVAADLYELAET